MEEAARPGGSGAEGGDEKVVGNTRGKRALSARAFYACLVATCLCHLLAPTASPPEDIYRQASAADTAHES